MMVFQGFTGGAQILRTLKWVATGMFGGAVSKQLKNILAVKYKLKGWKL